MSESQTPQAPSQSLPESMETNPAAAEVESLDMESTDSGEEGVELQEEVSEEVSEEVPGEHSQKQVDDAAKKVKAKEVKGSDGELFKIKVDGKDMEITKDEMVRLAQMGKAGQRAMQEKAELNKSISSFIKALKENPAQVLREDLGIDLVALSQETLAKQLEDEMKSPEQRRVEEMEAKLAQYEKERKEAEERREKETFDAEVRRYEQEIETQVMEAFNNWALPKTPLFLKRVADLMEGAYDKGLDVKPDQIVKIIKQDWIKETQDTYKSFSDKDLEEALGKDTLTRLRKNNIKKIKQAPSARTTQSAASVKPQETNKPKEKINMKDFLRGYK